MADFAPLLEAVYLVKLLITWGKSYCTLSNVSSMAWTSRPDHGCTPVFSPYVASAEVIEAATDDGDPRTSCTFRPCSLRTAACLKRQADKVLIAECGRCVQEVSCSLPPANFSWRYWLSCRHDAYGQLDKSTYLFIEQ